MNIARPREVASNSLVRHIYKMLLNGAGCWDPYREGSQEFVVLDVVMDKVEMHHGGIVGKFKSSIVLELYLNA